MAIRTAPTVDDLAVTYTLVTLFFIDVSGDLGTEAIKVIGNPNSADIETLVTAYQNASQASVYKVGKQLLWAGDADPDNADVAQRNSVKSGINLLWKDVATQQTQSPRVVAPVASIMQGNQDIPLLSDPVATALLSAYGTLLTNYSLKSAQYTDRQERTNNPRIKI